jgi:drug/metabolite transporter (DMT)-like permease
MNMATIAPARATGKGIAILLFATLMLATMDAVNKLLVQYYAIPHLLWIRFAIFCLFALAWTRVNPLKLAMSSKRPKLQLFRGFLLVFEIGIFILAFSYLPLADTHAIAATAPLIVTVLAIPLLGEKVGRHRWIAVGIGFIGALVIIRPGLTATDPAVLIAVAAAFVFAFYQLLSRMVAVDPGRVTLIYTAVVGFVVLSFIAPFFWAPMTAEHWVLMIVSGLLGAGGHFGLIKAFEVSDASALQPFTYSLMVFAAIAGWFIFGHVPDIFTILGAVIIAGSGIYVWRREMKLAKAG